MKFDGMHTEEGKIGERKRERERLTEKVNRQTENRETKETDREK